MGGEQYHWGGGYRHGDMHLCKKGSVQDVMFSPVLYVVYPNKGFMLHTLGIKTHEGPHLLRNLGLKIISFLHSDLLRKLATSIFVRNKGSKLGAKN